MSDSKIETAEALSWSFQKGWGQVQNKDLDKVREELMAAIHITTPPTWYSRLRGSVEPKDSERAAIEKVFAAYGITDIWGE